MNQWHRYYDISTYVSHEIPTCFDWLTEAEAGEYFGSNFQKYSGFSIILTSKFVLETVFLHPLEMLFAVSPLAGYRATKRVLSFCTT